jgi:hypothetical protein
MRARRTTEWLSALAVLVLCSLAEADKPKPAPAARPPAGNPAAQREAMEAHQRAMQAQFKAALEGQKKFLEAQIKAAIAAHQRALAAHQARMREVMEAARKDHERRVKAALEAERALEDARKKAITREEKDALARREKEARVVREGVLAAQREQRALEAQHKHISAAAAALSPEHVAVLQAQPGPFVGPLVQQLHQVRILLEHADHDYQGHRAAAVKEISGAIGVLDPRNRFKDKDTGGNNELQALSDEQLREAIGVLANDAAILSAISHPKAAKAFGHVGNAIRDLEVALSVK